MNNRIYKTNSERFWPKVQKTDTCWLWIGSTNQQGRGVLHTSQKGIHSWTRAPKLSYELHKGPVPEGLFVLHTCDNPNCVNPEHLYAGTHQDNVRDRVQRNRTARGKNHGRYTKPEAYAHVRNWPIQKGEANPNAKLTEEDIRSIRQLRREGKKVVVIANQFGISHPLVSYICLGKAWKHVK